MSFPVTTPIKIPVDRVVPTTDSLGFWTSAQVTQVDGTKWTIQFPPFPNISPISFTQLGKQAFTVKFDVQANSFTVTASFGTKSATFLVTPAGFGAFPQFTNNISSNSPNLTSLIATMNKYFSSQFPISLVGDLSHLRGPCATARLVMTPGAINATEPPVCVRAIALDLHIIPFQLGVGPANMWGIVDLATQASLAQPSPIAEPLTAAFQFFFGTNPNLYMALLNQILSLSSGGGGTNPNGSLPITNPITGTATGKPPKKQRIKK